MVRVRERKPFDSLLATAFTSWLDADLNDNFDYNQSAQAVGGPPQSSPVSATKADS
jgi:hypothetical protein